MLEAPWDIRCGMSNAEASFRLEVGRLATSDTQWAFHIFDQDDCNWSGDPKETYATRREATRAGEIALQRLLSKPPEQLELHVAQMNRRTYSQ